MFLLAQIKAKFILLIDNKAKKSSQCLRRQSMNSYVLKQRTDRKMLAKFNKRKYSMLYCEEPDSF